MMNLPVIVYGILYFLFLAFKLVSHPTPFFDWDESIYVQAGKEMVQRMSLTPTWSGHTWLEKPPLAPLLFGLIHRIIPVSPEISTRFFVLMVSLFVLFLTYIWIKRLTKNSFVAFLTVVLTSVNPIFLQRAQVVNIDGVMLAGWLGFALWYSNFWTGLFFLALGVYSKSVLGLYPLFAISGYQFLLFITKQISKKAFIEEIKRGLLRIFIMSIWYFYMLLQYGKEFVSIHFTDHLVRRVTSSIEFHFGKRTFYFDVAFEQFGWWCVLIIASFIVLFFVHRKNSKTRASILPHLLFFPWFIFLNLTKTKITWYLYPVIPQLAYLAVYPLLFIKNKVLQFTVGTLLLLLTIFAVWNKEKPLTSYYSQYDGYYFAARAANKECSAITVLVDKEYRKNRLVLQKLNLLITTTDWYSNHPALVYYFEKPVTFVYDENALKSPATCLIVHDSDKELLKNMRFNTKLSFPPLLLIKK